MLNQNNGQLKEWSPREAEFHAKWHSTLDNSNTIMPPTEVEVEIRTEDLEMFERALEVYEKLCQAAL